jgi:hypothetical protein
VVALPPVSKLSEVEVEADVMAEGHKILELRKKGWSHYEIGMKLNKSVAAIKKIEADCRDFFFAQMSPGYEAERQLLVAQFDQVIKESRSIAESAYEYDEKLKALNTTIKALYGKAKILGLLESKTTNTSVFIGKNEMRDLAILGYGK